MTSRASQHGGRVKPKPLFGAPPLVEGDRLAELERYAGVSIERAAAGRAG